MIELEIVKILYLFLNNSLATKIIWEIITNGFLITLIVVLFYEMYKNKDKKAFLFYVATNIFVYTIKKIISFFWIRQRPYVLLNINKAIHLTDSSFYSMHTFLAFFTLLFTLNYVKNKTIKIILIIFAILIGFARIVLAVHYPSDVLFSIVLAITLYILYKKVM